MSSYIIALYPAGTNFGVGGVTGASALTYTPAVPSEWESSFPPVVPPTGTAEALDILANRTAGLIDFGGLPILAGYLRTAAGWFTDSTTLTTVDNWQLTSGNLPARCYKFKACAMISADGDTGGVKFSIGGSDISYTNYAINAYNQTSGTSTCVSKEGVNQVFTYTGDFNGFYLVAEGIFCAGANIDFAPKFAVVNEGSNGITISEGSILQVTLAP